MKRKVYKNQRHIRWNWEKTPEDSEKVRYHFIIVDDKNREAILNKVIEPLTQWDSLEPVKKLEGKVAGTDFRVLYQSYDVNQKPSIVTEQLAKIGKPVKRDYDLKERKRGSIEDYITKIYE